jgi:hypothetical protein
VENISIDLVSDGLKAYEEEDYKTAFELFSQACDMGDANGCLNLGVMYYNGGDVQRDIPKAIELFKKACDMGDANGCLNLGLIYESGEGEDVQKDIPKAIELYTKACDMGYAYGCYRLECCMNMKRVLDKTII